VRGAGDLAPVPSLCFRRHCSIPPETAPPATACRYPREALLNAGKDVKGVEISDVRKTSCAGMSSAGRVVQVKT